MSEIVRLRAHAKVNLALRVGAPGADGFHPLATVFQTISLADRLTARPLRADEPAKRLHPDVPIRFSVEGVPLPEHNTVTHAAALLADLLRPGGGRSLRPLSLHLKKRVPIGAGLGGGSSDAIVALVACARLWSPGEPLPPYDDLAAIARQVGADVPYFLSGGTALGTGRGDRIEFLDELPQQWLAIAAPCSVCVATPAAYAAFDEKMGWGDGDTATPEAPGYSGELDPAWMGNDLHAAVIDLHPEVENALRALREAGAGIAQMSGSGSASFGTFDDRRSARRAADGLRGRGFRAWACVTVSRRQQARALGLGL
jgi:4-diphosphocytidyl-2-C-methyl-D-erythritol kinase